MMLILAIATRVIEAMERTTGEEIKLELKFSSPMMQRRACSASYVVKLNWYHYHMGSDDYSDKEFRGLL